LEPIWHITLDGRPAEPGPEGFVHASFASQLLETLAVHYPQARRVLLLRLDPQALGPRLVVEPSRGGALFPHVYGRVERGDVLEACPLVRDADGRWPPVEARSGEARPSTTVAAGSRPSAGSPPSAATQARSEPGRRSDQAAPDGGSPRTQGERPVTGATLRTASEPAFLLLAPRAVPRPWGGRRIAQRFGWDTSEPCGEWWLASSYPGTETALASAPDTSPAAAARGQRGAAAAGSSTTLATWLDGPGRRRGCPSAADFPVLLKFLDAEERLSLQVHPDDAVAQRHGLRRGKTEAWHILEASPGAVVHLGLAAGVTSAQLMAALRAGAGTDEVLALMAHVPVQAGDTISVPAGTVHALEGGLALFEVQQNSDATYRMHDWGRGRELHLERAADALRDRPAPAPLRSAAAAGGWTRLVDGPAFRLSRARVGGGRLDYRPEAAFGLLTVVAGSGQVLAGSQQTALRAGDTLLVLQGVELHGRGLDVLAVDLAAR